MSLRDIKTKIRSVDRTRKVTKAMETVSAVKMRKAQQRALSGRPYARAALSILERLSPSLVTLAHPLTTARPVRRAGLIVVTSDKGLCGVLNAAVLKESERVIATLGLELKNIDLYVFGRKAAEYFGRRGYTLKSKFENISDDVSPSDLERISRDVVRSFEAGEIDAVRVVYTNFKSTFEQEALSHTVLPFSLEQFRDIVAGIVPQKGAYAEARPNPAPRFYTVEPSESEVLGTLLPRLTTVFLYHMLLESKASEHSARMVAMKNASDKSRDLSKALTRVFNKTRQAVITREVSEIVGGIEAMAGN
ncbi:ATP synthase F1 subunit gamma [Patescibacteria group bacterium]|nr:ATP synthase F1 subunit gamma [Patescibacteria group bacterium]